MRQQRAANPLLDAVSFYKRGLYLRVSGLPNFKYRARIVPRRARGRVDANKPLTRISSAQRLKRVFAIDIQTCPQPEAKLQIIRRRTPLLAELGTKQH
jgi:hypothetical protein